MLEIVHRIISLTEYLWRYLSIRPKN